MTHEPNDLSRTDFAVFGTLHGVPVRVVQLYLGKILILNANQTNVWTGANQVGLIDTRERAVEILAHYGYTLHVDDSICVAEDVYRANDPEHTPAPALAVLPYADEHAALVQTLADSLPSLESGGEIDANRLALASVAWGWVQANGALVAQALGAGRTHRRKGADQ